MLLGVALLLLPSAQADGATSATPPRQVDLSLSVVRGSGARIVDELGRTVLLRGINVNQLGEYYTDNPANPSTIPLTERDFQQIAGLGFDVVRLLTTWSRWEPQPGVFDTTYLAQVRQAIDWARANDLYVIVDMHQDAWGPHIATPPSETCTPPLSGNVGWDGAPAWATLTDGLPTCKLSLREVSPAVAQAWTSFYADRPGPGGVGIQQRLVTTWGRIAAGLAGDPAVAGYDLLNEPNPGYFVHDAAALGRFYSRAVDAIRAGERSAGGPHRLVLFEPSALWSALSFHPTPNPGFSTDPALVFAPHVYAGSLTADQSTPLAGALSISQGHDNAKAWASAFSTTYFSGEWGWFGNPAEQGSKAAEYARQEDARLVGGAWWSWKQACGDPHQIGTPGNPPGAVSPSLVRYSCPGDIELGIPPQFGTVLSRSYPRAAPGVLRSLVSDPSTGVLRLTGEAPGASGAAATLDLWMPDRGLGAPVVTGVNVSNVVAHQVNGGWRISALATGLYSVHLRPALPLIQGIRSAATSAWGIR